MNAYSTNQTFAKYINWNITVKQKEKLWSISHIFWKIGSVRLWFLYPIFWGWPESTYHFGKLNKIKLKFLFFLQENSVDFESQVVAQIDEVIAKLDVKKQELLASIASAVQTKITSLKEQKEKCDGRLTATKGLLEYTNEAIKESDHATFLLISNSLCSRCVFTT